MVDKNSIVLSKVFRQPLNQVIREFLVGRLQFREFVEEGALRGFLEETDIQIYEFHRLKPQPLKVILSTPNTQLTPNMCLLH